MHINDIKNRIISHFFRKSSGIEDLLKRFVAIQVDPISIVAPNQQIVFAVRMGEDKVHGSLQQLYKDGRILEIYAKERSIILKSEAPLFWPLVKARRNKKRNVSLDFKEDIEYLISFARENGSISLSDIGCNINISQNDTWGPKKKTTMLLNLLWETGYLRVTEKNRTNTKYSIIPATTWLSKENKKVDSVDIRINRWKRYIDGVVVTDSRDKFLGFENTRSHEKRELLEKLIEMGTAVKIDSKNKKNICVVSKKLLEESTLSINVLPSFIPPLDNFIWNRSLVEEVWGMSYRWEIYTPKEKRNYGPYAMPLVTEEGLHGPINIHFNKKEKLLYCDINNSPLWSADKTMQAAIKEAARKLARYIGARDIKFQ